MGSKTHEPLVIEGRIVSFFLDGVGAGEAFFTVTLGVMLAGGVIEVILGGRI